MVRVSAWCAATVLVLAGGAVAMAQQGQVGLPGEQPVGEIIDLNGAKYELRLTEQRDNGDTVYVNVPGDHPHADRFTELEFVMTPRVRVQLAPGAEARAVANAYNVGFDNLRTYAGTEHVTLVAQTGEQAVALASALRDDARVASASLLPRGMRVPMGANPRGATLGFEGGGRLIDDPNFGEQWHLFNDGFVPDTEAGNDINVLFAWSLGYFGEGHTVLVVDDGIQIDHPDLAPNFSLDGSFDEFVGTPNPRHKQFGEGHGTACAGLIAADDNEFNNVGVAPDAGLTGWRVQFGEATAEAFEPAHSFRQDVNDITSNSYGFSGGIFTFISALSASELASFEDGITNGRGGLGTIFVKSGGNDRGFSIAGEEFFRDDASYDGFANLRYTISVAASDSFGVFSSFSEPGGVHIVNAPSSSFPVEEDDEGFITEIPRAGITTADVESFAVGPGDVPASDPAAFNEDNGFTTFEFGGTSASCPIVSGVVALMLDANPDLTWRDVQWILAETATPTDVTNNLRWQQVRASSVASFNGADRPLLYNNDYGFGRVNAGAAVALAEVWRNLGPEIEESYDIDLRIPRLIPSPEMGPLGSVERPLEFFFNVANSEIDEVQHVEFLLDLEHDQQGELRLELESPAGVVHTVRSRDTDFGQGYRYTFTAVKFLGNPIDGRWTLRVIDEIGGVNTGAVSDASLSFYGVESRPLLQDCNMDGFEDAYQAALDPIFSDCDDDGLLDSCAIAADASLDCDVDGVIDTCQVAADPELDCDGNGLIDSCQIAASPFLDFDNNNELDTCQIARDPATFDCNNDNILDALNITESNFFDCNDNGVLDSCEIASSEMPELLDANANGFLDLCEPEDLVDTNGEMQAADFTTINLGNDFASICGVSTPGEDFVVPVTITDLRQLTATLTSSVGADTVFALVPVGFGGERGESCGAIDIDSSSNAVKTIDSGTLQPGSYLLIVDSRAGSGDFEIDAVFTDSTFTCFGDNDNNGIINFGDFAAFVLAFDSVEGDANYNFVFDFDSDGDIDFGDFAAFVTVFDGQCPRR